mgnify:CR=1 FL=1
MANPLVTVVTPSFNQGKFIRATIESVLNQSYREIEYIVCDGGSSDETLEILKGYRDPRMRWVSEPDKGQTDAINKGIRASSGLYITYLNSDDILLPSAIQYTVDYFQAHPTVDILFGDCDFVDAEGRQIGTFVSAPFDVGRHIVGAQPIAQSGTFWRRQVKERIGDLDEHLHYTMDYEYWLRAGLSDCVLEYAPGSRSATRLHGESKTSSQKYGFLQEWERIFVQLFSKPDLPPSIVQLREDAFEFIAWRRVKLDWLRRDFANCRPVLRRFTESKKWSRRLLATTMLVDSYFNTPFTNAVNHFFITFKHTDLFN